MIESGEERRWWWLTQAHKIPMSAGLTRVFYPGWAGPGPGRGRGRTARQQPWSSLTRWRWIDQGAGLRAVIVYTGCLHFAYTFARNIWRANSVLEIESQAAKIGPWWRLRRGSWLGPWSTSGLETFCCNDRLINREIGRCFHVIPHYIRKVRRG